MALPRIGISVGDPAGIGPEVSQQAAHDPRIASICEPVLYASEASGAGPAFRPGVVSADGGRAAFEAVRRATADALAGRLDALTTAPINKTAWHLAGLPWRGHTDLLAYLTGASHVAMMLHSERLRVVLATVHIPLSEVPRQLTQDRVERTIALAHDELPWLGFLRPRLAVAGLNPHAGEQGLMGREEDRVLEPAIAAARARGDRCHGAIPGRHDLRASAQRRVRCRCGLLSRPGFDSGQARRLWVRSQRDPWPSHRADFGRPWYRVRHRRERRRKPDEHGRGHPAGGQTRGGTHLGFP